MRLDPQRFAAVVVTTIKAALVSITDRVTALEQRTVRDGAPGPPGERGELGPIGEKGLQGERGLSGELGPRGERGDAGERGPEGPEGKPGRDGRDGAPGVQGAQGDKGIDGRDGILGKDGRDGIDGHDGLGFNDLDTMTDEYGRMYLRFTRGDVVKQFRLPGIVDRGVYKVGEVYLKGDGVTWGGSYWIAQEDTSAKPGEASAESRAWRLAIKKGSDGKVGPRGPEGQLGKQGPMGPQGRQGY